MALPVTILVLAAAGLLPQEPVASPDPDRPEHAFGVARRADGAPWAGATVRLASEPFAGCADRDVLEVATDARGAFRVPLLPGRPYTAWAASLDSDRWLVSDRVDDVVPRVAVVLDERRTEPRVRLRVRGLEAWGLRAPLSLWCAGDRSGALPLPLRAGVDAVDLPPMGTGERWLLPAAGNGLDLFRHRVPDDARGDVELALPAPLDVTVTVRQPDGTPIAGARVTIRTVQATALPQRSDGDGRMTLRVPESVGEERRLPLWATAPGHLTSRLWPSELESGEPWPFFLMPGEVPAATVQWREGEPVADAPLQFAGVEASMEPGRYGRPAAANSQFAADGLLRTDGAGRVELPYHGDHPFSIGVLLPRAGLRSFESRYGTSICPLALVHASIPASASLEARIDALRPIRLVVRHRDRPAPRAHVRLGGGANPGLGLAYVADQTSSITVLVPPIEDLMVAAWHEHAGDVVRVAVPAARAGDDRVAEVLVELPEPLRVRGTVVDASGRPIAGAVIRTGTTLRGRFGTWRPVDAGADARGGAPRITARGFYHPAMAKPMFDRTARTDERGGFAMELPDHAFPLEFRVEHEGRTTATEWREAEQAGGGDGHVQLVLR